MSLIVAAPRPATVLSVAAVVLIAAVAALGTFLGVHQLRGATSAARPAAEASASSSPTPSALASAGLAPAGSGSAAAPATDAAAVLAALAGPLARANVPIFPIATHDTDWILVPGDQLTAATAALRRAGHEVG